MKLNKFGISRGVGRGGGGGVFQKNPFVGEGVEIFGKNKKRYKKKIVLIFFIFGGGWRGGGGGSS